MDGPEPKEAKPSPEPLKTPATVTSSGGSASSWISRVETFMWRRRIALIVGLIPLLTLVWVFRHPAFWSPKLVSEGSWVLTHPEPLSSVLVVVGAVVVFALWLLPKWQAAHSQGLTSDNRFDRENEARKTLAQIIGGVFVLAGLYSSLQTFSLQREGQIADRFTKAIEQLGAVLPNSARDAGVEPTPNLTVRLGGIYALEQISIDSPGYFDTVMEILSNYVRQYSPTPTKTNETGMKYDNCPVFDLLIGNVPDPPRVDIQAILDVIGRRQRVDAHSAGRINLVETNLVRAHMEGKNLQGVDFTQACLSGAEFKGAHLQGIIFSGTHLVNASFTAAQLDETQFEGAILSGAWLKGGVDLTKARGLCRGQVRDTLIDQGTKFPDLPAC